MTSYLLTKIKNKNKTLNLNLGINLDGNPMIKIEIKEKASRLEFLKRVSVTKYIVLIQKLSND